MIQTDDKRVKETVVIYEALCFNLAQGRMNGTPSETGNSIVKQTLMMGMTNQHLTSDLTDWLLWDSF